LTEFKSVLLESGTGYYILLVYHDLRHAVCVHTVAIPRTFKINSAHIISDKLYL